MKIFSDKLLITSKIKKKLKKVKKNNEIENLYIFLFYIIIGLIYYFIILILIKEIFFTDFIKIIYHIIHIVMI